MNADPQVVKVLPGSGRGVTSASLIAWALTLLLPPAVYGLSASMMSQPAALLLALMVGASVQWVFRLVPDFVVGLLMLWLCVLLDLAPSALAFSGFTSPVFLLVLGIFLLSALLTDSPWMLRACEAMLRHTQGCTVCRFAALVACAAVLTLVLPSPVGRSALLAPLLKPLAAGRSPRYQTAVVFALTQSNTVWSTAFLTGNPLNFVLLGLLGTQTQQRFQWLGWCQAAAVFALVTAFGLALMLAWLLHGAAPRFSVVDGQVGPALQGVKADPVRRNASEHTGLPMGRALMRDETPQRLNTTPAQQHSDAVVPVLYALLFAAVLMRPWHQIELHLAVGTLALVGFYLVPMSLTVLRSRLDWPTLLFIATLASWQPLLVHAGVSAWLEAWLPALVASLHRLTLPLPPEISILALATGMGVIRLVVPGAPAFIVLATALLPLSEALGLSPWGMGFVLLTLSEGFVMTHQHGVPSQVNAEAQALGLVLEPRRLLYAYAASWLLRVLALVACVPWWRQLSMI